MFSGTRDRQWAYVLLAVITAAVSSCAGTDVRSVAQGRIAGARSLIDSAHYDEAVSILQVVINEGPDGEDIARAKYLMGLSIFRRTELELTVTRAGMAKIMGMLNEDHVQDLLDAQDLFLEAAAESPGADFSPDAFYQAGRAFDHGFLQQFEEAMKLYKRTFERFPDSDVSVLAKKRYKLIKEMFDGSMNNMHRDRQGN